ncbi:hypothetical protein L596_013282 [Steinernema carpocapsae]|uniref:Uncharacterized protein n=1 Tax=Steinernema carpocapsae TaxID=34508 RepID=A0A4U5NZR1_STECR|nr:hypothetical protein L596_013282 [Steinernema carpocapsae]
MYRILPVTRRSKRFNEYFFSKIVPLWNSLPEVIVRAKNASTFKRKVRQWLFWNQFVCVFVVPYVYVEMGKSRDMHLTFNAMLLLVLCIIN